MKKDEFEQLTKKIEKLPEEVVTECYEKGMKNVLHRISSSAKMKVPVNDGGLRNSIKTHISIKGDEIKGNVGSRNEHAIYVEFGTGPKGGENHSGVSPKINVSYKSKPWFIPGEVLDKSIIDKYHFPEIKLKNGDKLYWTDGQKAQPFLYPAFNEIEPELTMHFGKAVFRAMKKVAKE